MKELDFLPHAAKRLGWHARLVGYVIRHLGVGTTHQLIKYAQLIDGTNLSGVQCRRGMKALSEAHMLIYHLSPFGTWVHWRHDEFLRQCFCEAFGRRNPETNCEELLKGVAIPPNARLVGYVLVHAVVSENDVVRIVDIARAAKLSESEVQKATLLLEQAGLAKFSHAPNGLRVEWGHGDRYLGAYSYTEAFGGREA